MYLGLRSLFATKRWKCSLTQKSGEDIRITMSDQFFIRVDILIDRDRYNSWVRERERKDRKDCSLTQSRDIERRMN